MKVSNHGAMLTRRVSPLMLAVCLSHFAWQSASGFDPYPITNESELVGTWSSKKGDVECLVTFKADHTFAGKLVQKVGVESSFAGTWSFVEYSSISLSAVRTLYGSIPAAEIHYVYTASDHVPVGTKDCDLVIDRDWDRHELVFLTSNKEKRIYGKVDPQTK